MRVKGKIVSWNNGKGFGFATPISGKRQMFIHISDFENLNRQPKIGQLVSYIPSTDEQGRPCGKSVLLGKDKLPKKTKTAFFSFIIVLFLFILATQSFYLSKIPFLILTIYVIASLITFIAYAIDKSAAKNGRWRTQESTLHLFSLLGGWPGAIIAHRILRHKTQKQSFRFVFWVTVILNIGILVWFHTSGGAAKLQIWMLKIQTFIASLNSL